MSGISENIDGWMLQSELDELAGLAEGAKIIVELGSYKGRSTKQLATSSSGIVIAIDNFVGVEVPGGQDSTLRQQFEENLRDELSNGTVVLLPISGEVAIKVLRALGITGVDMVFIDAAHDYDSVRTDIENFLPIVKFGGTICGHDYRPFHEGLRKAVDEAFGGDLKRGSEDSTIWVHRVLKRQ